VAGAVVGARVGQALVDVHLAVDTRPAGFAGAGVAPLLQGHKWNKMERGPWK